MSKKEQDLRIYKDRDELLEKVKELFNEEDPKLIEWLDENKKDKIKICSGLSKGIYYIYDSIPEKWVWNAEKLSIFNFDYIHSPKYGKKFSNIIFLGNADFNRENFDKYSLFYNAKFFGKSTSFEETKFTNPIFNMVEFKGDRTSFIKSIFKSESIDVYSTGKKLSFIDFSIFLKTSFFMTEFKSKMTLFNKAEFIGETNFSGAIFSSEYISFEETRFSNGYTNFNQTEFIRQIVFSKAKFFNRVDFTDIILADKSNSLLDFKETEIKQIHLSLQKIRKQKELPINLKFAVIDKFYADDVDFIGSNRETYTLLKDIYLKKNDRFKALEYHQKEMLQVLKENLNPFEKTTPYISFKKLGNSCLLGLELVSNFFGLSWFLPLFWLIIINYVFVGYGYSVIFNEQFNFFNFKNFEFESFFASLLPYNSSENIFGIKIEDNTWKSWYYIKNFVHIFLIYQFISSLRKYSRKL